MSYPFLQKALDDLDFNGEEIHDILKVISAILKLGNINFMPTTNMDGTEGCAISNDYGKKTNISIMLTFHLCYDAI